MLVKEHAMQNSALPTNWLCLLLLLFSGNVCGRTDWPTANMWNMTADVCTTRGCVEAAAWTLNNIDPTANPCHDFYRYACGKWIRKGGDVSVYFEMFQATHAQLEKLLRDDTRDSLAVRSAQKLAKLYRPYDNEKLYSSIPAYVKKFGEVPLIAQKLKQGMHPPALAELSSIASFHEGGQGNDRNPLFRYEGAFLFDIYTSSIPEIWIPGPYRWFFIKTHEVNFTFSHEQRRAYLENHFSKNLHHIRTTFPNLDLEHYQTKARVVDMIEYYEQLWEFYEGYIQTDATTTNVTIDELQRLIPEFNWLTFVSNHTIGDQRRNLGPGTRLKLRGSKNMFAEYAQLLKIDATTMRNVAFFSWYAYIQKAANPGFSWHGVFHKLVEHYLARDIFPHVVLEEAEQIVETIRVEFDKTIAENKSLTPETKAILRKKLKNTPAYLGYNKNALDMNLVDALAEFLPVHDKFSPVEIIVLRSRAAWVKEQYDIGDTVTRYGLPLFFPNAFNDDSKYIVLPIGILAKPSFDRRWPLAFNYGGLGMTTAHEFTYSFDEIDDLPPGNVGNDTTGFLERHQCLIDQFGNVIHYNEYLNISVMGDGVEQGREVLADNQGTLVAFRAYRKERLRLFHNNPPKLPGLQKYTNDQLFFIAHAQNWCGEIEELKTQADERFFRQRHPPSWVRINEDMKNLEPFATAFKCPLNSPMNPEKKCRVWRRIKKR